MNYREYQKQVMIECIQDACDTLDPNYGKDWQKETHSVNDSVLTIALGMFALRCKHQHYWEAEQIKKEFKDHDKGMTTDELALSGEGRGP